MAIKTLDDIEKEKSLEKRKKIVKDISEDVNEVIGNVFGKPKKEKKSVLGIAFKILIIFILAVITIDILLGSIWVLKFLIKSLFFVS